MQDFKCVKDICTAQNTVFGTVLTPLRTMANDASLPHTAQQWKEVFDLNGVLMWEKQAKKLIQRYECITLDEYRQVFDSWLNRDYTLEMDYDNLKASIKFLGTRVLIYYYIKRVRDMLPCNMTLDIECQGAA